MSAVSPSSDWRSPLIRSASPSIAPSWLPDWPAIASSSPRTRVSELLIDAARLSPSSASAAKRWSSAANPPSIPAIIRCDAESCSATRAASPSSEPSAEASRDPNASAASIPVRPIPALAWATSAETACACKSIPPRISSSASAERWSKASIVEVEPTVASSTRASAAPLRASTSANWASSRWVASAIIESASRVRSDNAPTWVSNSTDRPIASAPAARKISAIDRALASARGRSSSNTPMSTRADPAARSSASPCAAIRRALPSSSLLAKPSRAAASSPSPISWSLIVRRAP